jgi:hypothetical protein
MRWAELRLSPTSNTVCAAGAGVGAVEAVEDAWVATAVKNSVRSKVGRVRMVFPGVQAASGAGAFRAGR